eukprot:TRINITY_DN29918_c0_g1_i1.p1 TRINITY_DN29918_c0_g1~~TRINITY_DN29918_c0_g1_i1.p1  ORF type:complete len:804 (+),score=232.23 TRINITY_DN29918_c0_g1_i1:75-2486(+)
MPKVDKFAQQQKDQKKTAQKVKAENVQASKQQASDVDAAIAASQQAQKKTNGAATASTNGSGAPKSGKQPKSSAATGTFASAGRVGLYGNHDDDGDDDQHETPSPQVTEMPSKASAKKEATSRKKEKQAKNADADWNLEEETSAARKERIISRLMKIFLVGYFMESGSAENGGSNERAKKQKKTSGKKASSESSSFSFADMMQTLNNYLGPIMGLSFLILLMLAKISEENYSPDRDELAESHYDVLGIARDATLIDVKRAYKKLALQWHPDKNPDCEACAEKFDRISKASDVLSNQEKRKAYDSQKKAAASLTAASTVELTADNFEYQVLRSNDVWIVQVYDPSDGSSQHFHPVWEEASLSYKGVVKFGRIDASKNKKALEFLPQRVVLMPLMFRYVRGQEIETWQPTAAEDAGQRLFKRFIADSVPEVEAIKAMPDLKKWWARGPAGVGQVTGLDAPRIAIVPNQAQLGTLKGQHRDTLRKVEQLAHRWGEFAGFTLTNAKAVQEGIDAAFPTPKSKEWSIITHSGNSTSKPKIQVVSDLEHLPGAVAEHIAAVSEQRVPLLTVRNHQQLCGTSTFGRAARRYCLFVVDVADGSPQIAKILAELESSRETYAQEMAELAAAEGGGDGDAEDGEEGGSSGVEPLQIQPVRVFTGTSRWPWQPPGVGSGFSALWSEAKHAQVFLLEMETRRIAAITKSLVELYQQVAYEDLKLHDLPETLSLARALPDPEATLRREVMAVLTSAVGGLMAFVLVAVGIAIAPELSLPANGAAGGAVFFLVMLMQPRLCRKVLAAFYGGGSTFPF